ncbi:MAG: hypothetical protein ACWGQW_17515, partial [bacterium]
DYLLFPTDSWGGTTTNFAMADSYGANTEHIFAGQLNSGQGSLWRLNNFIEHNWGDTHSIQVLFGYGRMSFDQPSLSALDNPNVLQNDMQYTSAAGLAKLLSLGVMDSYEVSPSLSFSWGVDLNQISGAGSEVFVSPNAELQYTPTDRTRVRFTMSSKRPTMGNTLMLPDGRSISLASPLYLSRVGDELSFGTSRYYQGSFSHALGADSEVEVAYFDNRIFGGAVPVLAVLEYSTAPELFQLRDGQAQTHAYRATVRRTFSPNISAELSYIRGTAAGLNSSLPDKMSYDLVLDSIGPQRYQAISSQLQVLLPVSKTHITALVKFVPVGKPVTNVDSLSDVYETGNEGINLFIRQVIPIPVGVLSLFGFDLISLQRIEALLDIRNLSNANLARQMTPEGAVVLLHNPRSFRGGIALRF